MEGSGRSFAAASSASIAFRYVVPLKVPPRRKKDRTGETDSREISTKGRTLDASTRRTYEADRW